MEIYFQKSVKWFDYHLYYISDSIKTKLHMQKIASFALAVSGPPYNIAGYVPGSKVR